MRTLLIPVLLAGGACTVSAPPPSSEPEPSASSEPGSSTGEVPADASTFDASASDPLAGCRESRIEPTVTWTCGPHTVVLARYPDGLPPDRTDGAYRGGTPDVDSVQVRVGERSLQARVLVQPAMEGRNHQLTVLARDPAGGQVASCAVRIEPGQGPELLRGWCVRALQAALGPDDSTVDSDAD